MKHPATLGVAACLVALLLLPPVASVAAPSRAQLDASIRTHGLDPQLAASRSLQDLIKHQPALSTAELLLQTLKQDGGGIPASLLKAVEGEPAPEGPQRQSGGPDAFGYVWLDSDEDNGPDFSWVDISIHPNAVAVTPLTDDGFVAGIVMGIEFPFYGEVQTLVNVAMNGFINFGTGSGTLTNQSLPSTTAPNNVIAVFWDDLDPGDGVGAIHTLSDPANERFIVQWTGVPDYPGPSGLPNTFQVILEASGAITVQHLDMQGDHASATVGIENAGGTIGLSANYNNTGTPIANDKAIRFALSDVDIIGPTITHTPLINTDQSGGAVSYLVSANIVDMQSGVASAALHYQVNGGAFSTVDMTAGTPPAWTAQIPGQAVGATIAYYITAVDLANPANTSTSATWTFRIINYTLPPTGLTASEGLLDIVNLAWTAPSWLASAADPGPQPVFEDYLDDFASKDAAWEAFLADLAAWDAANQNTDRVFQNYNIYRDGALVGSSTTLTFTDYPPQQNTIYTYYVTALFSVGESDPSNSDTGNMVGRPTEGGPDAMGYVWRNSNHPEGPEFEWVDILDTGTQVTLTDDSFVGPITMGIQFPFYDSMQTAIYISSNGHLTFGVGSSSLGNSTLPNTATPNNLIAPFWDDLYPTTAVPNASVKYLSDPTNNRFIVQYTAVPHCCSTTGPPETFQAILYTDGRILFQYADMQGNLASATVGIENSTGTIGLQVNYNNTGGLINNSLAVSIIPQEGDFVPPLIVHTPLQSVETELQGGYDVNATISDESGVAAARIVYAVNGGTAVTVNMTQGQGNLWTGQIPHLDEGSTVAYRLEANDAGPNGALAVSPTWNFQVVSYLWPPINLAATDGSLLQTVVTWLAPINPGLLAERFGDRLPRDRDEGVEWMMEQGLSKEQALSEWEILFGEVERAFIQYQVYRDGALAGTTTGLNFTDNLNQGAQNEVVYTYTVRALFTAGESTPSNSDTGYWSLGQTSGGPDIFGYRWTNSSDPAGPTYQWIDILSTGTQVTLTDDSFVGPLAIGFSFPFYDNSYTDCYISSNGHITFGTGSSSLGNSTLPNTATPNNLIAPFWDDLYPVAAVPNASVKYLSDPTNNRFIVQFTGVPHCCSTTGPPETFQAILYTDGRMIFQYADMQGNLASSTVGIENATGTDGLQYIYNGVGAPLANSLAIRFLPPVGPVIAHTPLTNVETEIPGAHTVNAQITSDLGVASATVFYSINGGASQSLAMTHGAGNTWSAGIPHQSAGAVVAYRIEATDTQNNTRASQTWTFNLVSYTWPPVNLSATDGMLSQTTISWLPPVNPGLLAQWFGPQTPASEEIAIARLMAEHGMSKTQALATWQEIIENSDRVFIEYKLYRDGILLAQTTALNFVDDASQGSQSDVTYTYTVKAQFTAGESNASNADTGYWGSPPTFGGPDSFGYMWLNSLHPTGPDFAWVDISTVGQALAITGDDVAAPITLSFPFPFYGTTYTTAAVCSNGFINFGAASTVYNNVAIPNTALPNAAIFPLWDDLYIRATSAIYFYDDVANQRAIVQWNLVTPLGNANAPHTFQAILDASGIIKVQYLDIFETEVLDCTVGIENESGTVGLQVNLNGEGGAIADLLALVFMPPSSCEPVACTGTAEVEPNEGWNDNNASYNIIHCAETICGTVLANGTTTDTDWYIYTHFGGNITATLDVSDFDGRISLKEYAVNGATIVSGNAFPRCFDESFTVNGLAGGTYYIVVDHAGPADVTTPQTYGLSLVCSGDPCAGHTPIVCTGLPEVEPNEGWAANPPNANYGELASGETVCGTVWADNGVRDLDWFHFTVTATANVSITCEVDAFNCALFLADFDPDGDILTAVDAAPACHPENLQTNGLAPGEYFIVVGHNDIFGVPTPQNYSLSLTLSGGPEDPCTNYTNVPDFHDIYSASRPAPMMWHHNGTGCPGGVSSPGRDEITRIVLAQQTDLQITMQGANSADEVILFIGNCAQPTTTCGAARNAQGPGTGPEVLVLDNVPVGDYFIVADFAGVDESQPYTLTVIDMNSSLGEGREFSFNLEPNHPNPFNPTTTITWTQPGLAAATLIVHDMRGGVVQEIDLGLRSIGRHSVIWDASSLGSGVYFYTLKSGMDVQTRKALLVK